MNWGTEGESHTFYGSRHPNQLSEEQKIQCARINDKYRESVTVGTVPVIARERKAAKVLRPVCFTEKTPGRSRRSLSPSAEGSCFMVSAIFVRLQFDYN